MSPRRISFVALCAATVVYASSVRAAIAFSPTRPSGTTQYQQSLTFEWTASGDAVDGWTIEIIKAGPERQLLWSSPRLAAAKRSLSSAVPFSSKPAGELVWILHAYRGGRNIASAAKAFWFDAPLSSFVTWLEQISELRSSPTVLYAPHGRISATQNVGFTWSQHEVPRHFVIRVLEEPLDAQDVEPHEIWRSGEIDGTARTFYAPIVLSDSAKARYIWLLDVYTQPGQIASHSEAQSFAVRTAREEADAVERERSFQKWEAESRGETAHLLLLRAEMAAGAGDFADARRQLARYLALQDDHQLTFKALTTLVAQKLRKTANDRTRFVEEWFTAAPEAARTLQQQIADADLTLLNYDGALAAYRNILQHTPESERPDLQERIAQITRELDLQRSLTTAQ